MSPFCIILWDTVFGSVNMQEFYFSETCNKKKAFRVNPVLCGINLTINKFEDKIKGTTGSE